MKGGIYIKIGYKISGSGYCQNCDYTTVLEDFEEKLVQYDIASFDKLIHVYCHECGARHTSSPVDYLNSVADSERVDGMISALDNIDHMNMNVWYPVLSLLVANKLLHDEFENKYNISYYSISKYAALGHKADEVLYKFSINNNKWYDTKLAHPPASLIDVDEDNRRVDYELIYSLLREAGVDLSYYDVKGGNL